MESASPRILLIYPGPFYDVREQSGAHLRLLSQKFAGALIAFGERPEVTRIGNFDVMLLRGRSGAIAGGLPTLVRRCLQYARTEAQKGRRLAAVVTYDPLKTGLAGVVVSRLNGCPLIVEVNGDYGDPAVYSHLRGGWLRAGRRGLMVALQRFVVRRARGVKCLHSEQKQILNTVAPRAVIRAFPSYVELDLFRNLGDTREVLFVGHPFYLKGVDLLIRAFKSVSPRFPDWKLKILGYFPDPAELRAAVGGHPRIFVHPPVGRRDVAEHIGRCGILVLPSRSEAMGRVLLEAAACAKPRVGSAVGGIPSVISDEVDGLLFRAGDHEHLARQLTRLMSDDALRGRLGEAAAARAAMEFSAERYLASATELYCAVMSGQSADRPRRR